MTDKILKELNVSYKFNELMSQHTSFKIGGAAEYFVEPKIPKNSPRLSALPKRMQFPSPLSETEAICSFRIRVLTESLSLLLK